MLQQFDFNVDKAVQAFVDGTYACPPEPNMLGLISPDTLCFFPLNELNRNIT